MSRTKIKRVSHRYFLCSFSCTTKPSNMLFVVSRGDDRVTSDIETAGRSGTESAIVEFAATFRLSGHDVFVLENDGFPPSGRVIDVFIPYFHPNGIQREFLSSGVCDVPHTVIVPWHQCVGNDTAEWYATIMSFGFRRMVHMFVSEYSRIAYTSLPSAMGNRPWIVSGNALPPSFSTPNTQNTSNTPRPPRWIFHASFERGGDVACRVLRVVNDRLPEYGGVLHAASYYEKDVERVPSTIVWHGSLTKLKLRDVLDTCEYFVYPLVLPNGLVHHDTFACCVLEALSRGVIVVTWDVACFEDVYGDAVVRVPPRTGYDAKAARACDAWFDTEEAVNRLADAVCAIEEDPERKKRIRDDGIRFSRGREFTWSVKSRTILDALDALDAR